MGNTSCQVRDWPEGLRLNFDLRVPAGMDALPQGITSFRGRD
jgi:hypothetical protein